MPKRVKELSALEIKRLEYPHEEMQAKGNKLLPVFVAVGGVAGLQLQLTPGEGKSWALRYSVGGKRRSMGLGPYPEVSVAEARDRARAAKAKLRDGLDPIQEQQELKKARDAEAQRLTFAKAIYGWDKEHPNEFGSDKHRQVWLASVRSVEGLQDMRVDRITQEDVWRVLEPVAKRTPDTARRLRGRIETILAWAEDEKQREGENPAATGWLKRKLAAKVKGAKTENFPALQVEDAPRFMAALRTLDGNGSRALEFLMLTAARSGEVRGAVWDEIDLDRAVWTVPAARIKMKRDHAVPLPVEASGRTACRATGPKARRQAVIGFVMAQVIYHVAEPTLPWSDTCAPVIVVRGDRREVFAVLMFDRHSQAFAHFCCRMGAPEAQAGIDLVGGCTRLDLPDFPVRIDAPDMGLFG